MPAHRPDVTIIHAQKADRAGNVLVEGIIGVQKEAVLAAQKAIVTVEEIVDRFEGLGPNAVILPSWTIHAIVAVPEAHIRRTRTATTRATMPSMSRGMRSRETATPSSAGFTST